jgi:endonuclease/exonuclease/phosphatase family metal-dependent hydrolase
MRVVTFNTGSGGAVGSGQDGDFTSDLKAVADQVYGNGLAWKPAVEAARRFFAEVQPDIVAFQEVYYTGDCSAVAEPDRTGFVCESWEPGHQTVAQVVLGEGYQVMCHLGKPDKCAAVRLGFGSFQGCAEAFCLEGMAGARVPGCGSGSRVGRGVVELVAGGTLTLVNFHGSSGVSSEDAECRLAQVNQVFVDLGLGDGEPGASGERNLVLGDLNADPVRWAAFDVSAARWLDFVANPDYPVAERPFAFMSPAGSEAEPTYAALYNIDHVMSDSARGTCFVPGVDAGRPPVMDGDIHFDHHPIVCDLELLR